MELPMQRVNKISTIKISALNYKHFYLIQRFFCEDKKKSNTNNDLNSIEIRT